MNTRFVLFLLATSLLCGAGCSKEDDTRGTFPQNNPEKVFLKHAGDDTTIGDMRTIKFQADGITPLSEVVTLPDGSQKEIFYKPDFKPWRVLQYYVPNGSRQLHSETVFRPDGSFLSHSVYRLDRTQEETGQRLPDGNYEVLSYNGDGRGIARRRVLSKENTVVSEEKFDEKTGGTVSRAEFSKKGMYDYVETLYFDGAGVALYRTVKTTDSLYSDRTEIFFPGTLKVRLEVSKWGQGGSIKQFNLSGEEVVEWSIESGGRMRVEHMGTDGRGSAYVQYYDRADKLVIPDSKEWTYELDAVMENDYFRPDEYHRDEKALSRLIEFNPGEKRPSFLIIKEPWSYGPAKTTQFLNKDGKVVRDEVITEVKEDPTDPSPYARTIEKKTEHKFDIPVAPTKPLDRSRFQFQPFELPSYVDFPVIKVRPLVH